MPAPISPEDDLEKLVRELDTPDMALERPPDPDREPTPAVAAAEDSRLGAESVVASSPDRPRSGQLRAWLQRLLERRGSDLLLVAGAPPSARVDGRVVPLSGEAVLDGEQIEAAVLPELSRLAQQRYQEGHIADASLRMPSLGRFRVNIHR